MSVFKTGKMIYRNLGNSGLKTSVISLGNMINSKEENYEVDEKLFKTALENGVNHFDTAEMYDAGKAETQLGKILKSLGVAREDVVIATKIRSSPEPDVNSALSTSRKHIKESLNQSLKRLQLEYVDVLYAHYYDNETPLEEICRGFHEIIEDGKAFYWATSNWDAESVFNAFAICEKFNLHKPIAAQNEYSMLVRPENEIEYLSLFQKYNYGLVAWSPLAGGFLTGKYLEGLKEDELNRCNDKKSPFPVELLKIMYYDKNATEKNIKNLKELSDIATNELGCKLIHLALAWAIKYQYTSSALIGARNSAQLEDSLKALDILEKWTPELEARVNKILDTTPTTRHNFKEWKLSDPIRPVAK
jgi:voltage-dependent potassium channel beta subunit